MENEKEEIKKNPNNKLKKKDSEPIESGGVKLGFPLYCVAANCKDLVVVGGGGGSSKTGILNKIVLFKLRDSALEELCSFETGLEVVKCIAFHPILETIACGIGSSCIIFNLHQNEFSKVNTVKTDFDESEESEQKVVTFNSKGNILGTGGVDGHLRLWKFPSMRLIGKFSDTKGVHEEIDDMEFDPTGKYVAVIGRQNCKVWDSAGPLDDCKKFIPLNEKFEKKTVFFKGCKYSPDGRFLFIGKIAPGKRSWISKWKIDYDLNSWKLISTIIAHRYSHHNDLNISPSGDLLATGTSEGTIAVFTSKNLRKIMEVKGVHDFFITGITFSSNSKRVISVSADYSCKSTLIIPQDTGFYFQLLLLLAVITIVVAIIFGSFNT